MKARGDLTNTMWSFVFLKGYRSEEIDGDLLISIDTSHVKMNVDWAPKGNPWETGGGGIIRDHTDKVRFDFYSFYGIPTIAEAEIKTLIEGNIFKFTHIFSEAN